MTRLSKATILFLLAATSFAQVIDTHTTVRHHREAVTDQPAEIAQAEDAIQKNDFATAEALLKKALDTDLQKNDLQKNGSDSNATGASQASAYQGWAYQAWFDLGFALNGLNRADESIAAYRKSVAAKPDVFESNLNLGLMLARTHNPEAEKYLRAATTLKPTSHVEEGQARAWLSLGHALEGHDPDQAVQAYAKAAELTPSDPEPHLSAALLDEREKHFADAEGEYKKVLALDPHSTEAAIGMTNIYMKSSQLTDAEPLLRRLVADRPDDEGLHSNSAAFSPLKARKTMPSQSCKPPSSSLRAIRRRSAISRTFIWRLEKTIWRKPLIELWLRPSRITPSYIMRWDAPCYWKRSFRKRSRNC